MTAQPPGAGVTTTADAEEAEQWVARRAGGAYALVAARADARGAPAQLRFAEPAPGGGAPRAALARAERGGHDGRQLWVIEAAPGDLTGLAVTLRLAVAHGDGAAFLCAPPRGDGGRELALGALGPAAVWCVAPERPPAARRAPHDWDRTPGCRVAGAAARAATVREADLADGVDEGDAETAAAMRGAVGFGASRSPLVSLGPLYDAPGERWLGIAYARGRGFEASDRLCYTRLMTWPPGVGARDFRFRSGADLAARAAACRVLADFCAPIDRAVVVRLPRGAASYWLKWCVCPVGWDEGRVLEFVHNEHGALPGPEEDGFYGYYHYEKALGEEERTIVHFSTGATEVVTLRFSYSERGSSEPLNEAYDAGEGFF